ncbi:hypothetical protein DSECCO2_507880 [anaerobic digester metagenome]
MPLCYKRDVVVLRRGAGTGGAAPQGRIVGEESPRLVEISKEEDRVAEDLLKLKDIPGDDRQARREGLDDHEAKRLGMRRHEEDVRPAVRPGYVVDDPGEYDVCVGMGLEHLDLRVILRERPVGEPAHPDPGHVGVLVGKPEEVVDPFPGGLLADGEHHPLAGFDLELIAKRLPLLLVPLEVRPVDAVRYEGLWYVGDELFGLAVAGLRYRYDVVELPIDLRVYRVDPPGESDVPLVQPWGRVGGQDLHALGELQVVHRPRPEGVVVGQVEVAVVEVAGDLHIGEPGKVVIQGSCGRCAPDVAQKTEIFDEYVDLHPSPLKKSIALRIQPSMLRYSNRENRPTRSIPFSRQNSLTIPMFFW